MTTRARRPPRWNPYARHTCGDCGVREGAIHQLGCDMEYCAFCGGQLLSCDCCYRLLGLYNPARYGPETDGLPPEVYHAGLSEAQAARWEAMLEARGRIPYIVYPSLCARCGATWPDMFSVPDTEWTRYVQHDTQDQMLCKPCYDWIVATIDASHAPAHAASTRSSEKGLIP